MDSTCVAGGELSFDRSTGEPVYCPTGTPKKWTKIRIGAQSCPAGKYVSGFDATGAITCSSLPIVAPVVTRRGALASVKVQFDLYEN